MFNPALVKILGVVTSSGDDWSLGQVVWIFSVAIVSLGLAAAYAGKWLEDVGLGWSDLYLHVVGGEDFLLVH